MTDRIISITVLLDESMREDDAQPIIDTIMMIKGVSSAAGNLSSPSEWIYKERARMELVNKMLDILSPASIKDKLV